MGRIALDGCNELCIVQLQGRAGSALNYHTRSMRAQSRAIDVRQPKLDEGSITVTNFWATPYFPPPHLFPISSSPSSFFSLIPVSRLLFFLFTVCFSP
jgi:hypothetical protein